MNRFPFLTILLLLAALGGLCAGCSPADRDATERTALAPSTQTSQASQAPAPAQNASRGAQPPQPQPELQAEERATIALFEHASPAAVYITSLAVQQDLFGRARACAWGSCEGTAASRCRCNSGGSGGRGSRGLRGAVSGADMARVP